MEKFQQYKYEKAGVLLEFRFKEDPNIETNKMLFRELMMQAIVDLAVELNLNKK